jgi:hypothetical protein
MRFAAPVRPLLTRIVDLLRSLVAGPSTSCSAICRIVPLGPDGCNLAGLLRARSSWENSRGAAKKRDELPPSHAFPPSFG